MNTTTLNRERLTQCRKNLGITKQEAAKRMQMSQPAYLRYESGERTPSIHVIKIMADVLNTSAAYLTNETDSPAPDTYIIKSAVEPELFQFVEVYRNADQEMKERLLAYAQKLKEE